MAGQSSQLTVKQARMMQDKVSIASSSNCAGTAKAGSDTMKKDQGIVISMDNVKEGC